MEIPWWPKRGTMTGTLPTCYQYTGQSNEADLGSITTGRAGMTFIVSATVSFYEAVRPTFRHVDSSSLLI